MKKTMCILLSLLMVVGMLTPAFESQASKLEIDPGIIKPIIDPEKLYRFVEEDGKTYWYIGTTLMTGWCHYYDDIMYFDPYRIENEVREIEGSEYSFNSEGHVERGMYTLAGPTGDYTYFWDLETGALKLCIATDFESPYYGYTDYDAMNTVSAGWKYVDYDSETPAAFHFDYYGKMSIGWFEENGRTYYAHKDREDPSWGLGTIATGIEKIGNEYYFFDPDTYSMVRGWATDSGYYYYLRNSGTMVRSRWEWLNKRWTYFNYQGKNIPQFWKENGLVWLSEPGPDGDYAKGWRKLNGLTYYFRTTSGTRVEGWQYIGNGWHWFRKGSGSMAYGWQYIDGHWYYLRPATGTRVTGKQYIDGKWYQFRANGTLIGNR